MTTSGTRMMPEMFQKMGTNFHSNCIVRRKRGTSRRRPESIRYDLGREVSDTDGTPANIVVPLVGGDKHSARRNTKHPASAT